MPDADNTYIRRDMTRVSPERVSQAAEFQTPILADVAGCRSTRHGRVKPLSATMKMAAPALTLDVRSGDNLAIHAALAIAQPGEDDLYRLCEQDDPVAFIAGYGKSTARIMDAKRHVSVQSAPGAHATAVAEHAWARILACAKSVPPMDRHMGEGDWDKSTRKSLVKMGTAAASYLSKVLADPLKKEGALP